MGQGLQMRKQLKVCFEIISVFIICILFFLVFSIRWVLVSWDSLSFDEVLYHLKASFRGTNPDMIWSYIKNCAIPVAIICIIFLFGLFILRKNKELFQFFLFTYLSTACILVFVSVIQVDKKLGIISYVKSIVTNDTSDFVEDCYVVPEMVELNFPKKKRNVIYIFLESMEMTFADEENGGAFSYNCIPELTALAEANEDFSGNDKKLNGGVALPGATWTMAAMFGQASGVPLKLPINGSQVETQNSFFSGMTTFGDILANEGYYQELLIGSDAVFGGRKIYYENHGNYEIHDYNYMIENGRLPKDYFVFWGYEDKKLFEFAKEDLIELAQNEEPFNLTMLTVDTHFEDGYLCEFCKNDFEGNQYANVIACSSRQVSDFINWVQEQDFYKDTTIVICGDHPTMDSDFCNGIDNQYQRKTYTTIINSAVQDYNKDRWRNYSTFDLFPTTLAAMGVEIQGDKLGLGVNLYSNENTLIEEYGLDYCQEELDKPSDFLDSFANVIITEDNMKAAVELSYILLSESDDYKIRLHVGGMESVIAKSSIIDAVALVTDSVTGEKKELSLALRSVPGDPNAYWMDAETNIPIDKGDDLDVVIYISVKGFSRYKLVEHIHGQQ